MNIKNHIIFGIITFCFFFIGSLEAQNFNLPDAPFLGEGGYNQTSGISFDLYGNPVGKGKGYFNSLGKGTQSLSWDVLTGKVWGNQLLYDRQGRPAFRTLSAPTGTNLSYSNTFILNGSGSSYNTTDFDGPGTVVNPLPVNSNSQLGAYYSNGNNSNPYQDVTSYPFVRTIFSRLNPGSQLRLLGGNKISGEWKQSYTFSMPMGNQVQAGHCSSYYFPIDGSTTRVTKTIIRDVHGEDTVIYKDSDGNTLAAARSGVQANPHCDATDLFIGPQGYVDIHIAKNVTEFNVSDFDPIATGGSLKVYNLISEELEGTITSNGSMNVTTGFYRIVVANTLSYSTALNDPQAPVAPVKINHIIDYYDFSFNLYDKAGRLTSTTQPKGGLESTYAYNSLGQLLEANSPDEGNAKFLYRKDGQIRFSQNELQAANGGEFSYTNYDDLGRPIESGIITDKNGPLPPFSGLWVYVDSPTALDNYYKKEVHHTVYDIPDTDLAEIFTTRDCQMIGHHYQQAFVAGNVVQTYTEEPYTSTTWYSYDVLGRVTWIVQKVAGMRCPKTIDYTYHPATGQVVQVDFQQKNSEERFIHRYQYNAAGQLIKVFTSRTGLDNDWKEQASYFYAESGELVRTVIAEDLQGIDFVYNLSGQLKAINHPSLLSANDPGGDGANGIPADVFGLALDYYNGDYARTGTPTPIAKQNIHGTDQFNGNLKGLRYNTQGLGITGGNFQSYMYGYNRNNWLKDATYGLGNIANNNGTYGVNFTPNSNGDYSVSNLTYDANGNILTLKRDGYTDSNGSNNMDDFDYSYTGNRLRGITDSGDNSDTNRYDDLRDQSGNGADNYIYNELGQLVSDAQGQKVYEYNASGLVSRICTFGGGGNPQIIFLQDFSLASNIEANEWNRSLGGDVKIQYFDYIPDNGTNSCAYLNSTYGKSLKLELSNNQNASRLLNVAAGIPHTLDLNVIVDQWDTGQRPAGYTIEIYNSTGPSIPASIPLASKTYNSALAYIDDPDLSGTTCDKYYENSESLTFTPTGGKIRLVIKKLTASGSEPIYLDNISMTVGTVPLMDIAYNDRGQRLQKKVYSLTNNYTYFTYYIRDVAGTIMGIYSQTVNQAGSTVGTDPSSEPSYSEPALEELPLYGSGRIGVLRVASSGGVGDTPDNYVYQLTDHLGNVRAVISKAPNGTPVVIARTDYYPFGMPMPNRNVQGSYRYGYQGEFAETDPETGMPAFELRLWDARIGRWLTTDPYEQHFSPYMGMGNNPISTVDPDGGCDDPPCWDNGDYNAGSLDEVVITGSGGGSWGADGAITLGGFQSAFAGSTALYQQTYPEFAGMDYNQMVDQFNTNHGERFEEEYAFLEAERIRAEKEALALQLMNWGQYYSMASIAGPNYNIPRVRFGPRVGPIRGMNFNNPNSFKGLGAKQVKQHFQKHGWSVKETKNGWSATNPKNPSDVYKFVKGYKGSSDIPVIKQGPYLKNGYRLPDVRIPLLGNSVK
ncbi:RHS repeat domain-containing protein [Aequorivita sp. CIP111184]|uniref:RHS repeat domain-containing protein n=1 Tax=Aequorivita sp. CIP111184 TaxID=2211356 RepID=UPI000DBC101A|nr:RHS repeat-associated core domain-containing protein [Aequorivita sp. CIP111184]SRX52234.1 hypothetical protein AEQU1_00097 [Aequorivita sp. CIP111184]